MLAGPDRSFLREAEERRDAFQPIPNERLLRPPPRREWMVDGCFPKATVAMVSGDGGIGKSLLMMQLLACASLGLPWLGMATTAGRGLFLSCEDDEIEQHHRLHAICRHLGYEIGDVLEAGLDLHDRVGRENTLTRLDRKSWRMEPTPLFARLLDRCLAEGISYVVIDTATQTFAGNQNDEQQVVQFINQLRRLAIAIQGIVIMTKHPSLTGRSLGTGESGNTAWNNSVRSRLYLREGKDGLALQGMKANYSGKVKPLPLRWERGVFVLAQPALRDYTEAGGGY